MTEQLLKKPTYEELERRFQNYCKHDGGRGYRGAGQPEVCAICEWDLRQCQHRKADGWDKFCRECGAHLQEKGQ